MAYRSYFRSVINDNFKILTWVLILFTAITPNFIFINSAHASAAEKWEVLENNYDHTKNKVEIEARKITQQASNMGRYKVQIPVNPNTLGATAKRMLFGGVAVGAITAVVEGVGWVIDEASQQIIKPVQPEDELPFVDYYWIWNGAGSSVSHEKYLQWGGTTPEQACQEIAYLYPAWGGQIKSVQITSPNNATCYFNDEKTRIQYVNRRANPWTQEGTPPQPRPVSDFELGNEILGNGTEPNSRTQPAEDIITDAYSPHNPVQDAPAPQESIEALENANPEPETEPKGETETEDIIDPETGEKIGEQGSFELPAFCSWAPSVCDFFTVQKKDNKEIKENQKKDTEQNKTFFDSVKDWFDWSKEMPNDTENGEVPIQDASIIFDDSQRITFANSCPMPEQFSVSFFGASQDLEFSYQPLCDFMTMIKPFVIAGSYLIGAYIVMGLSRGSGD